MPPPSRLRRRRGPLPSYETWRSFVNQDIGLSQPRLGHDLAAADQSTSAGSFVHISEAGAASNGLPMTPRPDLGTQRSSELSAPSTQQQTQCSDESKKPYQNLSATTPSEGNPTKKPRVSGRPRSQAGNNQAQSNLADYLGANPPPPDSNGPTASEQSFSAGSIASYVCRHCQKKCSGRDSLRRHKETHDPIKKSRHKCPDCPKGFRYPKDMNKHWNSVHAGIRVLCEHCGKSFTRGDNVVRHQKVCRGGATPSSN